MFFLNRFKKKSKCSRLKYIFAIFIGSGLLVTAWNVHSLAYRHTLRLLFTWKYKTITTITLKQLFSNTKKNLKTYAKVIFQCICKIFLIAYDLAVHILYSKWESIKVFSLKYIHYFFMKMNFLKTKESTVKNHLSSHFRHH